MLTNELFGPYRVLEKLGEGGMGAVYRARDTKLNRDVALKVLLPEVANDPERLARFRREAQVLASLNQPNIGAIHGLEESGDTIALVLELVEGPTLADRMARGPIPLDEALPIAKQIAEALEAAHEQGIIHRDLKPANIKVRDDGMVKVLDFGLAKAVESDRQSASRLSISPTITSPAQMTAVGVILGTAAYMAPEQAKGRAVDKRGDIWAFGCVLYEMLTAQRAFPGDDITDTIVAVISREPDFGALPGETPAAVRRLLTRCLKKDIKARLRDIGDARQEIEAALGGDREISDAPPTLPTTSSAPASAASRALPWAIALAATAALLVVLAFAQPWRVEQTAGRALLRLDLDLGDDVSLPGVAPGSGKSIAISPDGTRLAYISGTPTKVFTRRLDQPSPAALAGTEGAQDVFFSADGQWLGFAVGRKISKTSVEGGAVVPVADMATTRGASWAEDGSVFAGVYPNAIRIPFDGGAPQTIAEARGGELSLTLPDVLPGGKAVLLTADYPGRVDRTNIEIVTLADRQRRTLVRGAASARYIPTSSRSGHLIYVSGPTLFAVPFDPETLNIVGSAVPIVDDVRAEVTVGTGQFDVSRNGTLIYRRARGNVEMPMTALWLGPAERGNRWSLRPGAYTQLSLSPDGRNAAMTVVTRGGFAVWLYDSGRDVLSPLTSGSPAAFAPLWSGDGKYVVFSSLASGILQARGDGSTPPQVLVQSNENQYPTSFSPDGKRLAYWDSDGGGKIWTVPVEDDGRQLKAGKPEPFLTDTRVAFRFPSFAPDGRWLAYQSRESGGDGEDVFVRTFPPPASGAGGRWQISTGGGAFPRWLPDRETLIYQSGDQLMAVPYSAKGDSFVAGKSRPWLTGVGGTIVSLGPLWDLSQDGKRVAVLRPVQTPEPAKPDHVVVFVQNFFDELRRRAPLPK